MRSITLLLLTLCVGFRAFAAPLTFRVDMRGQVISSAGVHVAGSFQSEAGFPGDWDPATTALLDADGDSIYEATFNVPAATYLFKFVNGTTWPTSELVPTDCGFDDGGGNVNRVASLGTGPLRLPIIPFGGCLTTVRLAVNMAGRTVAPTGIHVAGNFQALAGYGADWDPVTTPLTDPDGDGVYDVLLALPAPGLFQYKFVNGSAWTGAETVPAACGLDDGTGNFNRILDATAAVSNPPALCFGACGPCGAAPVTYATHWWNDAVFYEIFVRSFYDSNGDGRGDFAGLTAKLDYLNDGNPATTTDLGVTGIWLMPMMQSPSYHGYDVTNYKATETDYGTMAEFETFLAAAHARGIKVILDLVLNHISSQHTWFAQGASSPTNSYRDWFIWSPTNPGYSGPWGQTVWHPRNGQYFYGVFYDGMPDLNWRNPAVKAAMWDVSRFWLRKGVDGYRLDAIKHLIEDGRVMENAPETFPILEELHDSVRAVNPEAFTVGEAFNSAPAATVPYVVNDRLDACFEFSLAAGILSAVNSGNPTALRLSLNQVTSAYPQLQYATFLTNHDQNRVFDALGRNMDRMKQAASLYLTMPGVPFIYYGEEVGMNGSGPDEDKRLPMQWSTAPRAGFTTGNPWRTPNPNYAQYNVATMAADPNSLLNHYKKLIQLRTASEPLRKGYYLPVTSPSTPLLGYARVYQQTAVVVVANVGGAVVTNPAVSLAMSSLAAGTYDAVELYTGQAVGTLVVDNAGGFNGWVPAATLGINQTWVLQLTPRPTGLPTAAAPTAQLSLYPNPAAHEVQVELTGGTGPQQLGVYNLTGQLLFSAHFTGDRYALATETLANGPYFVKVTSGKRVTVQRLVIQK
jgi:alpha-amylase